jgi:hypothetical protein
MKSSTLTCCAILLLLATVLPADEACADATSAASTFFGNLKRLGHAAPLDAKVDAQTLVTGVYRLEDSAGQLVGLITESGDIIGDSSGWRWITKGETRPLSPEESARLRTEVLQSIDWGKLIRVQYGNGGGRRIFLLSAVNCPICARMEDALAHHAASIDTMLYVLPISLSPSPTSDEGRVSWRQAANLWCATDSPAAWRKYWATREVPVATGCALDEVGVFKTSRNFSTVMSSIGVRMRGTPAMIREDGTVFSFPIDPDERYFREVLGADGLRQLKPQAQSSQRRWLAAPH